MAYQQLSSRNLLLHPWANFYKGAVATNTSEAMVAIHILESEIAERIFRNELDPITTAQFAGLFMPYHENGTFCIGERGSDTPFLRDEETKGLEPWLLETIRRDLHTMLNARQLPNEIDFEQIRSAEMAVTSSFGYKLKNGHRLCDLIPNQNYIDYVRRGIALYLFENENREFDTESTYTQLGREISLGLVGSKLTGATPKTLMTYAILAGILGLELKCSFCAASSFDREIAITIEKQSLSDIWSNFLKKASFSTSDETTFAWSEYEARVLKRKCVLAFFPDDLPETVFDLFQIQTQLNINPTLEIDILPRAGMYHNDASYLDVERLFDEPVFDSLRQFRDEKRVRLHDFGPRNGSVEGPKLSRRAADRILEADALYVKGARAYELLGSGIRIPTFFAQAVAREFSESICGIDARASVPVLLFSYVFPSFWGFRKRARGMALCGQPDARIGWYR